MCRSGRSVWRTHLARPQAVKPLIKPCSGLYRRRHTGIPQDKYGDDVLREEPHFARQAWLEEFCEALLWIYALDCPWKWDRLADVLYAAQPGCDALDTHSKTRVRDGAIFAKLEVPLKGFFRQVLLVDALKQ